MVDRLSPEVLEQKQATDNKKPPKPVAADYKFYRAVGALISKDRPVRASAKQIEQKGGSGLRVCPT
jgi:hypothetical protein